MIALDGVSVRAGLFSLSDITFRVPRGGFGVVVGAAGAGKTTLLEAIAGVRRLHHGSIVLHERAVTRLPPEQRGVGLVYQRGALFPHKSVGDNIAWATPRGSAVDVMTQVVDRLGLAPLFGTPVPALSGGERQLVALARALVRVRVCLDRGTPAVLLLDEPFSALDPRRRMAMRDAVRAFHREWSLTTLQVTHDGADARHADVAILLDAGRIVQSGAPEELLQRPARDDVALFLTSGS